jgi:hypothetical protein
MKYNGKALALPACSGKDEHYTDRPDICTLTAFSEAIRVSVISDVARVLTLVTESNSKRLGGRVWERGRRRALVGCPFIYTGIIRTSQGQAWRLVHQCERNMKIMHTSVQLVKDFGKGNAKEVKQRGGSREWL